MNFPELTANHVLSLASVDNSSHVVDHLSVHRDIALARVVKLDSQDTDDDHQFTVAAQCDEGTWRRVDAFDRGDTIDCQFGGGTGRMAGRELTYQIDGIVTMKTTVSRRGNWSFVYSDPEGRSVAGTSTVQGDFSSS